MSTPNRGPQLLVVNYFFAVLAFLTVLLRSYVRIFIVKRFSADDAVMVVAMVIFELYCSVSIGGVYNGTGQHHADLTEGQIKRAMRFWWFCYIAYALAMMASKISIAIFLLRLVFEKIHKWILYAAIAISVVAGCTFFFVTLFQCNPVSLFWDKDQPGKCLNPEIVVVLAITYSVFAVISDLIFVILPTWLVWNLKMKRRAKIALVPLLSMGCVASAAVFVRFPYLLDLNSPDFLWDTLDTALWSTVEQGLAISAGSLATTRPLFRVMAERYGWTSQPSGKSGPEEVTLTPLPGFKGRTLHPELESTPSQLFGNAGYGYHASIAAGTDTPDNTVTITHHIESARRQGPPNKSEDWLIRTHSRTFV